MADLIAIGYDDEATAAEAAKEVERVEHDLLIEPDAVAVIVRDGDGSYHVQTSHHAVTGASTYGMIWGPLFGLLFFVPVFGMAVGSGLCALIGKVERLGIDGEFQHQVRDLLQPGTSALFLVVQEVTADEAIEALSAHGGSVVKSPLSPKAAADLQEHLHGAAVA
jgi:uncharacterized membrane protein